MIDGDQRSTLIMRVTLMTGILVIGGLVGMAQTQEANQTSPAFEVAAIKRGQGMGTVASMAPNGRFTASNETLKTLLMLAYGVQNYQVLGGPDWINSDRYTITAKAGGDGPIKKDEHARMLQSLLKERFQLKVHREIKDLPAYALVVDKGTPKLKENVNPDAKSSELSSAVGGAAPAKDGTTQREYRYTAYTMQNLATRLTFYFRSFRKDPVPVLDRTGLTGRYDFTLPWTSDTVQGFETGISIFTAVREQLGLRLEKGKYPLEIIVIDSVERPSID